MKIDFKNKPFNELTKEQKIALVERVCMEHSEYLSAVSRNTNNHNFLRHWRDNAVNLDAPSNSAYLDHYYYSDKHGLCVWDKNKSLSNLRYNTEEIVIFVHNVVSPVPARSPIIDRIIEGKTIIEIEDEGIEYGSGLLSSSKVISKKKLGRPKDPNSLYQKVKRGELTRYEAYQKNKSTSSDDDAL